jgi:hypothetical protein
MKSPTQLSVLCWSLIIMAILFLTSETASADPKQTAIQDGLSWLASIQQGDGSISDHPRTDWKVAVTASAVQAFVRAGYPPGTDFGSDGDVAGRALDYVISNAVSVGLPSGPHGNPDANGNGFGIRMGSGGSFQYEMMTGGIVLQMLADCGTPDAIVATGPLTGKTHAIVMQDMAEYLVHGQTDYGQGRGGWRYSANQGSSDNSTSQWPVFGLYPAEIAGVIVPEYAKEELRLWINYIQYKNPGHPDDGSSGYCYPNQMNNITKTSGLLLEMLFAQTDNAGAPYDLSHPDLVAALGYIDRKWPVDYCGSWCGNFNNPNAMWASFLALKEVVGFGDDQWITNLREPAESSWYDDYCNYLVDTQSANGSWHDPTGVYRNSLTTSWYVTILLGDPGGGAESVPASSGLGLAALMVLLLAVGSFFIKIQGGISFRQFQ